MQPYMKLYTSGSRIHDPFVHALKMCSIMHYKYVVVIIFCISRFCSLLVAKTCNVAQFGAIETQLCALA